jgi:hypothetical protein
MIVTTATGVLRAERFEPFHGFITKRVDEVAPPERHSLAYGIEIYDIERHLHPGHALHTLSSVFALAVAMASGALTIHAGVHGSYWAAFTIAVAGVVWFMYCAVMGDSRYRPHRSPTWVRALFAVGIALNVVSIIGGASWYSVASPALLLLSELFDEWCIWITCKFGSERYVAHAPEDAE